MSIFKHVPKPNTKDEINILDRKDQVIIFRLRTTHIQLNFHLSRITKDLPPSCTLRGYKEETVSDEEFSDLQKNDPWLDRYLTLARSVDNVNDNDLSHKPPSIICHTNKVN